MNKKHLALLFAAVSLFWGSPLITGVVLAKPFPMYNRLDTLENGYVVTELLYSSPRWGGKPYGYRVFDPKSIHIVEENGVKIIRLNLNFFNGKKIIDPGIHPISLDVYNGFYRDDFEGEDWSVINNPPIPDDPASGIWNNDVSGSRQAAIDYIKDRHPDIYWEAWNSEKAAEERARAEELERLRWALDSASEKASSSVYLFEQYGKQISWDDFSRDAVDYTNVPPLSDLIGRVFYLSDNYGLDTVTSGNISPTLQTQRRASGLVHFTILPGANGRYQIALMDDTGAFVGEDNINRKPLAVGFSAYHEDYGYYQGLSDVFHKTGSFSSDGRVIGRININEGLSHNGAVSVSLEKTDSAGKYRLVYYVTKRVEDSYGGETTLTERNSGFYATLELVQ